MSVWLTFLLSLPAVAAIFGADDRVQPTGAQQILARATALQVPLDYASLGAEGKLELDFASLAGTDGYAFCPDERFAAEKVSPIACTGFLVAPDLLVTAGHCVVNWTKVEQAVTPQCDAFAWLFDYQVEGDKQPAVTGVDPGRLVRCKRVEYANFDFNERNGVGIFGEDIALVRLERPVTGRPVLSLAAGSPGISERVSIIGYPLGLPAKAAAGRVSAYGKDFFRTDLDVSGGFSGSPVFNARGQVAGVLVRAFPDTDFVEDQAAGCRRWNRCENGRCLSGPEKVYTIGAEVQRIQALLPHLPRALSTRPGPFAPSTP